MSKGTDISAESTDGSYSIHDAFAGSNIDKEREK